jgi:hypothetical protein
MNTTFHTPEIERAYASLALTPSENTLHVRIGPLERSDHDRPSGSSRSNFLQQPHEPNSCPD